MIRIALTVEYDGARYSGWQSQAHAPSIQARIEEAVSRVADHPVDVVAAGRTDAGVHALQQVVHFDTDAERTPYSWIMGVNTNLPGDIRITGAFPVSNDFHARYLAIARFYRYVILNRLTRSALRRHQVTWHYRELDAERMGAAGKLLIGEHDFSAFRAQGCQSKSPFRRLYWLSVARRGEDVIIDVVANAFLHHMVRNIVGVLLEVGDGRRTVAWCKDVLASRQRVNAGVTAPPDGLYFGAVLYPAHYQLPGHEIFEALPKDLDRVKVTND